MSDKADNIIFKTIFFISGLMLVFDWTAKLTKLPYLLMAIGKWLTAFTYPIIAIYVFCMGWTLSAKDMRWIGRPKIAKIALPVIKYFILFAGALLLPSCLMFWIAFPAHIASTVRMAVIIIFPVTALLLGFTGKFGVVSPKGSQKPIPGHNKEDAPDQKPVR